MIQLWLHTCVFPPSLSSAHHLSERSGRGLPSGVLTSSTVLVAVLIAGPCELAAAPPCATWTVRASQVEDVAAKDKVSRLEQVAVMGDSEGPEMEMLRAVSNEARSRGGQTGH